MELFWLQAIIRKGELNDSLSPYFRLALVYGEKRPALPAHANVLDEHRLPAVDDATPGAFDATRACAARLAALGRADHY